MLNVIVLSSFLVLNIISIEIQSIMYPATFITLFISPNKFLFPTFKISLLKQDNFNSFFTVLVFLTCFACQNISNYNTVTLIRSFKSGHSCLVLDLKGKPSSFTIGCDAICGLFMYGLIVLTSFSSTLKIVEVFKS